MKVSPIEPQVVYEDNHLIAVNKPFGMPAQGDNTRDLSVFDWVKEYIRVTYNKPGNVYLALLHRIDRPTGGLMILAKTSKAAARVSQLFQTKRVEKGYYAITNKVPSVLQGELTHYLKRIPGKNITKAYQKEVEGSKIAQLEYEVIQKREGKALIAVRPLTGRQHQIRTQNHFC